MKAVVEIRLKIIPNCAGTVRVLKMVDMEEPLAFIACRKPLKLVPVLSEEIVVVRLVV